jgi:hypothetical protein
MREQSRLVVCTLGDPYPVMLPASRMAAERNYISGGERSLYELAVAAASTGMEVELRGDLNEPILDQLISAAGAAPRTGLQPRRPDSREIVVSPEGASLDILATAALSEAKWVIHLLAAPGLMGWSFLPNWSPPNPMVVPIDSLGLPESYRAMDRFGLHVWTNSHGIAEAGGAAGVDVDWIGTGTPIPFPEVPDKNYDLAVVGNNRWAESAEQIARQFTDFRVLRIGPTPSSYSLCEQLAQAKVLIWPSRVEGMSRIAREARAVGTVPVALDISPFAIADDHGRGVVLVRSLHEMEREVRSLLADQDRWERLSREAVASAKSQADWPSFVSRVEKAVSAIESGSERPDGFVRHAVGDHLLSRWHREMKSHDELVGDLRHNLAAIEGQLGEIRRAADHFASERSRAQAQLESSRQDTQKARAELDAALVQLDRLRREVETVQTEAGITAAELNAYRNHPAIRIADRLPLAAVRRARRAKPPRR